MPDYLRPVRSGEPFDVKAPTWNAMLDAARAYQNRNRSGGGPGATETLTPDVVDVYNDSGASLGAMCILGIESVMVAPGTDLQQFLNQPLLRGVTPTSTHLGKFVVTANAIAAGGIGRAIILGTTAVKVNMLSAGDGYADATIGDMTKLTSGSSGPARILFAESGTGTKWAIVRMGGGGGGPAGVGQYKGMVYSMVADTQVGWEFLQYTPWTP